MPASPVLRQVEDQLRLRFYNAMSKGGIKVGTPFVMKSFPCKRGRRRKYCCVITRGRRKGKEIVILAVKPVFAIPTVCDYGT